MVHTLFTWRYGGREVLLCSSFDGWTEQVPMILGEGSTTVFQAICDLPPGYHQYKFLVDGVWRVDDQQLCVQDQYGINNLVLVKEPEIISLPLLIDAFQPCMDVDVGIMQLEASSSGGLSNGPMLPLLANEIEVSRHRLSMHLSFYKTYELIPNSSEVTVFDVNVAVEEAFHVMHDKGLAVVPLLDEQSRQISGMLTASDFILLLVELHRSCTMLTNELLEMSTISAWKEGKHREAVGTKLLLRRRPLIQISTVPVLHFTQDGSYPQLLHLACLAGILRHICRHFRHRLEYLPLLQQPVGSLPLGTWKREAGNASGSRLLTLSPSDLLSSALKLLMEAQISSIPIVDDKGALLNVFSRSDITSLAKGKVYTRIQLEQTIISQALELVDGAAHNRYQTCKRSDSLYRVMELLSYPLGRRIIVTAADSLHVEGIITLRD
ncbi:hypothetical protein RJ639_000184, partial [Escallonia herrerae]